MISQKVQTAWFKFELKENKKSVYLKLKKFI